MFRDANKSIQIVTNADGLKELYKNHYDYLKKAKSRGVDVRVATLVNDSCIDVAKDLGSIVNVRAFDKNIDVKGNFYIVDGKELVFALTDPGKVHDTQHVAIWSRSEHATSDVLEPLFRIVWNNSKSL